MVSVFGMSLLGSGALRLFLLNIAILYLNFILWSDSERNVAGKGEPRMVPAIGWSDRHGRPTAVQQREPEQDYDADTQRTAVEAWKRRSGIISKKSIVSISERILNGTKRQLGGIKRNWTEAYQKYEVPSIAYTNLVNCDAVLRGDEAELKRAEGVMRSRPKVPIYEEQYLDWTADCERFKKDRGYVQVPLSREEEEFPLAFSLAVYKDVEQMERLLRAVYQPQNLYCIHVDTKSSLLFHQTVLSIARCFDNVWVSTRLTKVKWGDISVILPEINCMKDLLTFFRGKYKYFINLTGQEFPLRTNLELVRIAKIFNGSNDIAGSSTRMEMDRVSYRWTHRWSKTYQQTIFYNTFRAKAPYKTNLTFFKGELHGLFSRRLTEYIIESEHGRQYLDFCWDTGHPSEHYWNTLNYNKHLGAPGGYEGPLDAADKYSVHPVVRVKNWVGMYDKWECRGRVLRGICVYGVRDVPWLATRRELFANKFNLTYDHLGLDCLEERHRNRTKMRSKLTFDEQFYRELPTVKYGRKDGL